MIAFDIDGVLCNFTDAWITASNKLGYNIKDVSPRTWSLSKAFDMTDDEVNNVFASQEMIEALINAKPYKNGLEHFNNAGKTCIISARGSKQHGNSGDVIEATREWLKFWGINTDYYSCHSFEKSNLCKELGVVVMYEDHPETVKDLIRDGIHVRMPVYEYNKHLTNEVEGLSWE